MLKAFARMFKHQPKSKLVRVPAAGVSLKQFRPEVVVIGAGIVGSATALYLARAGVRVAVLERAGVAGGTSGSGEGNILLSDKLPGPELDLARRGVALWRELRDELPDDYEYEPKGGVVVADRPEHLPGLERNVHIMQAAGVRCELLPAPAIREAEPYLNPDIGGAVYFPDDAQVQPMLATSALLRAAIRHGAAFFPYMAVTALTGEDRTGVCGLTANQEQIYVNRIVIAAGPWSASLARLAGAELPVQPRKGHILVTEPLPRLVRHKVFEAGYADTVNSGEADLQVASVVEGTHSGTILIGSSRQLAGFDSRVEVRVLRKLAARAVRFFPVLGRANALRAYIGFRAFMPDHLPAIGELPGVPGLYVNTGHEGAGIGLGPVSGRLLSQLILGQEPLINPAPFNPARFASPT